jgi:hypothetical protein
MQSIAESVDLLKKKYIELFSAEENRPTWAKREYGSDNIIHPSIPFVGKHFKQTRILLYASAENLTKNDGSLDLGEKKASECEHVLNRHRAYFEKPAVLFPNVHIQPLTDGGLVNVIGYVAMKLCPDFHFRTPRELLEGVAFANFGKFTIENGSKKKNADYANDYVKLSASCDYIQADLEILAPEILIMPKAIYGHKRIKECIGALLPNVKVIPIFQISHYNINRKDRIKKFSKKEGSKLPVLNDWHGEFGGILKGKTRENFYSFYTYLDEVMKKS